MRSRAGSSRQPVAQVWVSTVTQKVRSWRAEEGASGDEAEKQMVYLLTLCQSCGPLIASPLFVSFHIKIRYSYKSGEACQLFQNQTQDMRRTSTAKGLSCRSQAREQWNSDLPQKKNLVLIKPIKTRCSKSHSWTYFYGEDMIYSSQEWRSKSTKSSTVESVIAGIYSDFIPSHPAVPQLLTQPWTAQQLFVHSGTEQQRVVELLLLLPAGKL